MSATANVGAILALFLTVVGIVLYVLFRITAILAVLVIVFGGAYLVLQELGLVAVLFPLFG